MGKYIITKKALEDLSLIWNYTYEKWSESQADDYYNLLIESFHIVAQKPEIIGKDYNEIMEGLLGFKVKK
ncbi:MAG: type II toxin-antitoxin system RelE/ParE family toxin, partial [Muribaculaceae bacterium]|nr:type II toxin-antitoxin system RelE/ParE family toxin [Muribaculaceae bacterium]